MIDNNSLEAHKVFKSLFEQSCQQLGFIQRKSEGIASKIDPSVYFVGAGISLYKADFFSTVPNMFVLQPCFRSHNLNLFRHNFDASYSSFFISPCIISNLKNLDSVLTTIVEIHKKVSTYQLQVEVHMEDQKIYNQIAFLKSYGVDIKKNSGSVSIFRHVYGDERLMGKTMHFRVIYEDKSISRVFGNLSIIYVKGEPKGIDYGTGISTYLSCLRKQSHSISSSPVSDLYPVKTLSDVIFCDCLTATYEIAFSGIKPLANKRGRILRDYLNMLIRAANLLKIPPNEIYTLLSQYENYIGNKSSMIPQFIFEYIDVYQRNYDRVSNIQLYVSKNIKWYQ